MLTVADSTFTRMIFIFFSLLPPKQTILYGRNIDFIVEFINEPNETKTESTWDSLDGNCRTFSTLMGELLYVLDSVGR